MTSRPRVYARIRPQNVSEEAQGGTVCLRADPAAHDVLLFEKDSTPVKTRFDHVFDANSTQHDVFEHIGTEVLSTLFSGYNASIFAYGMTSSGKTYTMEGEISPALISGRGADLSTDEAVGLTPRLFNAIFARFEENKATMTDPRIECSYVQIYQEHIQDLFNNQKALEIHMDKTGSYVAAGATWMSISNAAEALRLYKQASKNRNTSATDMNVFSSRSHAIFMVKLTWDEQFLPGLSAQLNLIDLAGSEKLYQSNATGEVMKEAIHINKSLSSLATVVIKLVEQARKKKQRIHIPYKDSKLTSLLQSSLGGTNLVHFILALSGSSCWRNESHSTVEFGKRVLQLVIRPVRNPIDYKRMEEMEVAMERMRNHIQYLEEELRNKQLGMQENGGDGVVSAAVGVSCGDDDQNGATFLKIRRLQQGDDNDEEARLQRRTRRAKQRAQKRLRELKRIMENLPETLDELASHCVLFPISKGDFRELGGIPMLVEFIKNCLSTFNRAHAAHTIVSVIDDAGREELREAGAIDALFALMSISDEQCRVGACVGLDAMMRGSPQNKAALKYDNYKQLVALFSDDKNQHVQEAACACLATLIENNPSAKVVLASLDLIPKLLSMLRTAPAERSHALECATTCAGRLAQGDATMQRKIAEHGGVSALIDNVLFSDAGKGDYQVPVLASYALVNLCCNNRANMAIVNQHPRAEEVRYKLMTGIARAFGQDAANHGFGRATAEEKTAPFTYYGVTLLGGWDTLTNGGVPQSMSFIDNPQFYLYVAEDTRVTLVLQDTLYEKHAALKQKGNSSFIGLAVYRSDPELVSAGMRQVDFRTQRVALSKFTSNRENVINCVLKKSSTPYIVVPFLTEWSRLTKFALSAFGEKPLDLLPVAEVREWTRQEVLGSWTEATGRGSGTGAAPKGTESGSRSSASVDWRCNPQVRVQVNEDCRVYFVLGYTPSGVPAAPSSASPTQRAQNSVPPALYGRLFEHTFASNMRYLKAFSPLPSGNTFVALNTYSSSNYVVTSALLKAKTNYCYVPYTERPYEGRWSLRVLAAADSIEVTPVASPAEEWFVCALRGRWDGSEKLVSQFVASGRLAIVVNSRDTFMRASLGTVTTPPLPARASGVHQARQPASVVRTVTCTDKFWSAETNLQYEVTDSAQTRYQLTVEGVTKTPEGLQVVPSGAEVTVFIFSDAAPIEIREYSGAADVEIVEGPSAGLPCRQTATELLQPPVVVTDNGEDTCKATEDETADGDEFSNSGDMSSAESDLEDEKEEDLNKSTHGRKTATGEGARTSEALALKGENDRLKQEVERLRALLSSKDNLIAALQAGNRENIPAAAKLPQPLPLSDSKTINGCGEREVRGSPTRVGSPKRGIASPSNLGGGLKISHEKLFQLRATEHQGLVTSTVDKLDELAKGMRPKTETEWRKMLEGIKMCQLKLKKIKFGSPVSA